MNQSVKSALIIGGVIVAVLIIVPLIFGLVGGWQGYGMIGLWMMGGFGGMWFMPIFMVIFWGLVIWGIVALARGVSSPTNTGTSGQADSFMEVLKRRYARGEINKDEFEEGKKDVI